MKTVKQVSELTGISVRTLHYYDEIGLFKPSKVTEAGYRYYDDDALQTLQQILFFRELDFPLKDIRAIMLAPGYDKNAAFVAQRKLVQAKRDRLTGLLELLDKLIKGEECMNFKVFDMTEYTTALEDFIASNTDEILRYGGDLDEFQRVLETLKSDGSQKRELAKMAIDQYGSIERFTQAMKDNMAHFPQRMEELMAMKDHVGGYLEESNRLMRQLTTDLSKDPASQEIQQIVSQLAAAGGNSTSSMDMGPNYWGAMAQGYLTNPAIIASTDQTYGEGASAFIGNALMEYSKR